MPSPRSRASTAASAGRSCAPRSARRMVRSLVPRSPMCGSRRSPDRNLPPELEAAVREALALRGTQTGAPTPPSIAVVPIDVTRPGSLRTIEAAMQIEPRFVAVFAQRALETERPTSEDLHPTGSLCIMRILHRTADDVTPPGQGEPDNPSRIAWILGDRSGHGSQAARGSGEGELPDPGGRHGVVRRGDPAVPQARPGDRAAGGRAGQGSGGSGRAGVRLRAAGR